VFNESLYTELSYFKKNNNRIASLKIGYLF